MGRNLWVNESDFSRDFTVLVWDDLLGVLPSRPEPPEASSMRTWIREILESRTELPVIYQIWRRRENGWSESAVAHAWKDGVPLQIEGCYDELRMSPLGRMPELDYAPPVWKGAEHFAEAFSHTPLTLQAEPLGEFFRDDLERLFATLESGQMEWGIL